MLHGHSALPVSAPADPLSIVGHHLCEGSYDLSISVTNWSSNINRSTLERPAWQPLNISVTTLLDHYCTTGHIFMDDNASFCYRCLIKPFASSMRSGFSMRCCSIDLLCRLSAVSASTLRTVSVICKCKSSSSFVAASFSASYSVM